MHVVVVGAGAFGGWTALYLLRGGAKVTLVDSWGPGNSKSSSGGETRIIRSIYGDDVVSTRFSLRSLALWKEHEKRWNTTLFERCGALFLGGNDDEFLRTSSAVVRGEGATVEELSPGEARKRYPEVNFDGIGSVLYEPDAGLLFARENCRTVVRQFIHEGGTYRVGDVEPLRIDRNVHSVRLSDGTQLHADHFVFAAGAWMQRLLPDVLGDLLRASRQEVLFFATPPGEQSYRSPQFPCWADRTSAGKYYGIPDVQNRGFKIASDLRGPAFDPDTDLRLVAADAIDRARDYLRQRFPKLASAPLTETRVCQYENTPDLTLLVDRHPAADNVLLMGGGSGHGYKQSPALGEYVAEVLFERRAFVPELQLGRFVGRARTEDDFQGASI